MEGLSVLKVIKILHIMNNANLKILPVILCGGAGTRLWPLSRVGFPKQFLALTGTTSLFQEAVKRVNSLSVNDIKVGYTLIVTGEEHRFLVLDQLSVMPEISATLLLEPVGCNTAPALTFASLQAVKDGEDPILVVTPADQTVENTEAFSHALQKSIQAAADGSIVLLGITPDKPETGYGYIKVEKSLACKVFNDESISVEAIQYLNVESFVEKPDAEMAKQYLAAGRYYWNSGIFVLKASVWLKALAHFSPTILTLTERAFSKKSVDAQFVRPDQETYKNIPSDSVDYAVLEKLALQQHKNLGFSSHPIAKMKMVPLDAGWSDVGSWDAVWQMSQSDDNGNVSNGDVILAETKNTFVHSSFRLVSTLGVDNLVIIETPDAILIANKSQSQHVKKIVRHLVENNRSEDRLHRKVYRPWGWYDTIDEGLGFKVKRIQVKPGESLSLQKHAHRAEHWVVIRGTAEITNGEHVLTLSENQSTYIPPDTLHRLSNPGDIPLEIIEVQSGSYVGEDDIVRIEDTYGRV
jgi:mannose-1-phosphate guanylyltransferase/mannose-6-phosphate isomerase